MTLSFLDFASPLEDVVAGKGISNNFKTDQLHVQMQH